MMIDDDGNAVWTEPGGEEITWVEVSCAVSGLILRARDSDEESSVRVAAGYTDTSLGIYYRDWETVSGMPILMDRKHPVFRPRCGHWVPARKKEES